MKFLRVGLLMVVGAALGGAQTAARGFDSGMSALESGRLVLWIVHPAGTSGPLPRTDGLQGNQVQTHVVKNRSTLPSGVSNQGVGANGLREVTAGDFGTASSDTGQTAGSYGQPASTLGAASSDVGQTSSTYGQTSASFGTASSDTGQTAGSYGQTAGSFGQTASTYGESLSGVPNSPASGGTAAAALAVRKLTHTAEWDSWAAGLRAVYPGLTLTLVDVPEETLLRALAKAAGTADAPDALLGWPLPTSLTKSDAVRRLLLARLGMPSLTAQTELPVVAKTVRRSGVPEVAVLRNAPHLPAAKALAVMLADAPICPQGFCGQVPKTASERAAAAVAMRAVRGLLQDGTFAGDADRAVAAFDGAAAKAEALAAVNGAGKPRVDTSLLAVQVSGRLAVVELRAAVSADEAFGVLHSLVVLRLDEQGRWKVLQMSPDVAAEKLSPAAELLRTPPLHSEQRLVGVSSAAPADGETRGVRPDLWWDNGGGAGLEVVEWQRQSPAGWLGTRLFFVPDRAGLLRTRVTAQFADTLGTYRWRVWSLGNDGAVVLSPWRVLTIDH